MTANALTICILAGAGLLTGIIVLSIIGEDAEKGKNTPDKNDAEKIKEKWAKKREDAVDRFEETIDVLQDMKWDSGDVVGNAVEKGLDKAEKNFWAFCGNNSNAADTLLNGLFHLLLLIIVIGITIVLYQVLNSMGLATPIYEISDEERWIGVSEVCEVSCTFDRLKTEEELTSEGKRLTDTNGLPIKISTDTEAYAALYLTDKDGNIAKFGIDKDMYVALSDYQAGNEIKIQYGGTYSVDSRLYRYIPDNSDEIYYLRYIYRVDGIE